MDGKTEAEMLELFAQFEIVREDGRVNMMGRSFVIEEADRLECWELVAYLSAMDGSTGRTGPEGRTAYMAFLDDFSAWKEAQDGKE